ncbi:MAG: hypothetical protein JSV27_04910 [Candidatus Bathyarchaeota archaeon]|nr:MAG: hypothetical protein JSV27_04910 [Candidatus Bathyarchaeota archaeon]
MRNRIDEFRDCLNVFPSTVSLSLEWLQDITRDLGHSLTNEEIECMIDEAASAVREELEKPSNIRALKAHVTKLYYEQLDAALDIG